MIVVMEQNASENQISHIVERVEAMGLKSHVIVGAERTVIAAIGNNRDMARESLKSGPGVAEVVSILAPYKVASIEVKQEPTQLRVRDLVMGAGAIGVIAGPCSVESEEQVVVYRGMGTIIALSFIAIILIGFFPSGLMSIALDSIPF